MSEKIRPWLTNESALFAVPLPEETPSYKPVSHKELAYTTLEAIYKAGFKIDKHEYSSNSKGSVANARYTISNVADSEMQLEIGWQNSYNKTLSLKFAIGTRIFICENGCVSGDMGSYKRMHTGTIQTEAPPKMIEYIKSASEAFEEIQKQRERMKEIEVSDKIRAELIGRMFIERDIISSTQLNIIKKEIKKPTFDYGAKGSLWELYNYTTFAMKELHPFNWLNDHMKVHSFFTDAKLITTPEIILFDSPKLKGVDVEFRDPAQISILDVIEENK